MCGIRPHSGSSSIDGGEFGRKFQQDGNRRCRVVGAGHGRPGRRCHPRRRQRAGRRHHRRHHFRRHRARTVHRHRADRRRSHRRCRAETPHPQRRHRHPRRRQGAAARLLRSPHPLDPYRRAGHHPADRQRLCRQRRDHGGRFPPAARIVRPAPGMAAKPVHPACALCRPYQHTGRPRRRLGRHQHHPLGLHPRIGPLCGQGAATLPARSHQGLHRRLALRHPARRNLDERRDLIRPRR